MRSHKILFHGDEGNLFLLSKSRLGSYRPHDPIFFTFILPLSQLFWSLFQQSKSVWCSWSEKILEILSLCVCQLIQEN